MVRLTFLALFFFSAMIFALPACHSTVKGPASAIMIDPTDKHPVLPTFKRNPEFRAAVKKDPVAEYRIRTESHPQERYFSVRLYETPETMKYIAKVEFEGCKGADTIKLPDMGTPPHPVLQKGEEKYACIIGLLDNDRNFRELKKVYVMEKGEGKNVKTVNLKITTLKHYIVTEDYRLVSQ